MIDPELAARSFYNANGGSYELPAGAPVTLRSLPDAAPAGEAPKASVGAAEPAATVPAAEAAPAASQDPLDAGLYSPVTTRGMVDWTEPAAQPEEYDLSAPSGTLDSSPEAVATLGRVRDAFAAAGAGVSVARELWNDATRFSSDPRWGTPRALAEAQLREHFGARYDEQVALASGLVKRAAARCPEIVGFLERTGLGNDPDFIKKLATAARRRRA